MNVNMGNLNLEVSSLKNKLAIEEKALKVELAKEREFQKEYNHNIKIWKRNKVENEQKVKTFIQKLQDENKQFKVNTTQMKSQVEELQELKQKAEVWDTTERKWSKSLLIYKQQQKVLGSQVEFYLFIANNIK